MSPTRPGKASLRVSHLATAAELGFDVTVKRSPRRRTMEINVRDGRVRLMLPSFVSNTEGRQFLQRKRAWVLRVLDKHRQRAGEVQTRRYVQGERFPFLGRLYPLEIHRGERSAVHLSDEAIRVTLGARLQAESARAVQERLWGWYKAQALDLLTRKTDAQVTRLGRSCQGVRLRRTKTKWGHCTASGVIQYNWQIVGAPESVVDYLVAHEVSHLVHLNHSRAFWQQVEALCPDYREQRRWLQTRGHTLDI